MTGPFRRTADRLALRVRVAPFLAIAMLLPAIPAHANEEEAEIGAAIESIFRPYGLAGQVADAPWHSADFSGELRALADEWQAGLKDGDLEELNSFDWFCQCQDFDPRGFRLKFEVFHAAGTEASTVDVAVNPGGEGGAFAPAEFYMIREGGEWLLDDIVSESFPRGLKADLAAAIVAHKAASLTTQRDGAAE